MKRYKRYPDREIKVKSDVYRYSAGKIVRCVVGLRDPSTGFTNAELIMREDGSVYLEVCKAEELHPTADELCRMHKAMQEWADDVATQA